MALNDITFVIDYYVETGDLFDGVADVLNIECADDHETWIITMEDGRQFTIVETFAPVA